MGAGCSNGRALAVQDSVTKKITLTREAKEHLKNYSQNANLNTSKDGKRNDQSNVGVDGSELNASRVSIERKFPSVNHALLWDAVETNDVNSVEELIEKISSEQSQLSEADLFDSMGNSMAHKAASLGHAEILMLLLERSGAKPDISNAQLSTPLHLACKNNRESVAKFLIGCGVDVNGQDEHGQTPLLICCIHGNQELAQIIIESSAAGHTSELLEIDIRDHRGLTSLNCAAIKGDLNLAKLLIEKGGANIETSSPKGCTPAIYAARGGYEELLQYLILVHKASAFKQDNSGATLFHHAVEKSNITVLKMLLTLGVDVSSGIEIADNAGRTPIFEAVDNNSSGDLIRLMIKKRQKKGAEGGYGAKINVLNYNGQTPLFSAVREGNMEHIRILIEEGEADADMNGGEMIKDDSEENQAMQEDEFESTEEKNFVEAYKNCMTPLQLSCILGQDEIALYLIERAQANPNLQTIIKGYACLHLSVLANKPEMVIELLTRTNSNPNLPDYSGRTLIEMVEKYIPYYLENFTSMIENLQLERLKRADHDIHQVATHYYNPDDEREIKGFKDPQQDLDKRVQELEQQEQQQVTDPEDPNANTKHISQKRFLEMDDSEIEVEEGKQYEKEIDNVFGRKIALGFLAVNFKFKEIALKIVVKHSEKLLSPDTVNDSSFNIVDFVRACTIAVDLSCKERVVKVFNLCLQLLTMLITSQKIDQSHAAIDAFKRIYTERSITLKLLQRSEEGNTRLTNKIHECLLDYSFHPRIGEAHVSSFILQRLNQHNKQSINVAGKPPVADSRNAAEIGAPLGSYKGLLAQLALLYKFVNSFGVSAKKRGPLNARDIVNAILPSLSHSSQDVRSASTKILLDVQRLSGAVREDMLSTLPEKIKVGIVEKVKAQVVEKDQNQAIKRNQDDSMLDQSMDEGQISARMRGEDVDQEANSKEPEKLQKWTGSKDESLKGVQDYIEGFPAKKQLPEEFLQNSTVLLKSSLEDNNFNLYLQALDVSEILFKKALFSEIILGSLPSLVRPIILRTADTNTRIRKRSVDLINQIWSQQLPQNNSLNNQKSGGAQSEGPRQESVSNVIADVICDSSLQERAIIGRLGLFIKKAQTIEAGFEGELTKKPHQVILGRNYEQMTEFASQWALHKNTKVRQNALKLITEICRINSIDSRGMPFKQRVVNMIIMLRPSIRDPLIQNINQVCSEQNSESEDTGPYINVTELELNLATKQSAKRAASMDVHKQRAGLVSRQGTQNSMLPEIGGGQRNRPREGNSGGSDIPTIGSGGISLSAVQPSSVLPHSEPLTDELKKKGASLIELFGVEVVTCFYSQTWSSRLAAIEKVEEQLHNLDPNRRDAMSAEINRKNLPIENNFKTFLEFIDEGSKDPVLKNLIAVIELLKKSLPNFFRYIQPLMIRKDLMPVVSSLIKKTTDLKAKVREIAIDFCLYLSHQSPIGPEVMVNAVLTELELVLLDQPAATSNTTNVAANMGNSHMISSCFKLLNQFQLQSKILEKSLKTFPTQPQIYTRFIALINASLKHSNPQVRKEGETLFKTLYLEFGEKMDSQLVGQKAQVLAKVLQEAKQDAGLTNQAGSAQQQEYNVQRAQTMIRTEMLNQSSLSQVLKGQDEHLQALKLPNPKKRLNAVVELKKAVQKELVTVQANAQAARNLFEPLSMLIRQLLADEDSDIYLETLSMLRAVVGALVPHMSTLDVHLMLGSFIGVIVANTVSGNIRTQIASDKVIIFFAKHNNIGPFIVAKDILKNIEKSIKAISVITKREDQIAAIQDKKPTIMRFLSILQLLLQHFSIVLCYQTEFYDKCIEIVADSMVLLASEDQAIKNLSIQLIISLQKIDSKLLEQAIQKLDFTRKTPLRKAMIELEHQSRSGKNVITQDHHAFSQNNNGSTLGHQGSSAGGNSQNMVPASPMGANRNGNYGETRGSNVTASSRTSLFSPGTTLRGASPGGPEILGMTGKDWGRQSIENSHYPQAFGQSNQGMNSTIGSNNGFKNPEGRAMRRMISTENENPRESYSHMNTPGSNQTPIIMQARQSQKQFSSFGTNNEGSTTPLGFSGKKELILPEIINTSNTITPLASTTNFNNNQNKIGQGSVITQAIGGTKIPINATGGAGFSSSANYGGASLKAAIASAQPLNEPNMGAGGIIRPPLYVPQKREAGRAATGMLNGSGIQGLGQPNVANQPQQSMLNRTGPLPSTYQAPLGSGANESQQNQQSSQAPQYKTEFNSNLYSGTGIGGAGFSSAASTSGTSSNIGGGARSNSLQQKKPIAPVASNLFKGSQYPQPTATFETNVTKYKETSNINGGSKFGGESF